MGEAEGCFAVNGVSATFAAASNGSLDEGVFPGGIKFRVKITEKVTSAREIFWSGCYAKRSVRDVTGYSEGCGIER